VVEQGKCAAAIEPLIYLCQPLPYLLFCRAPAGGMVVDDEALLPFAIGFQFIEEYIFWSLFQVTFCTRLQAVIRVNKNDITVLCGRQSILHLSVAVSYSIPAGSWTIGRCTIESEGFFVEDCPRGQDAVFSYA